VRTTKKQSAARLFHRYGVSGVSLENGFNKPKLVVRHYVSVIKSSGRKCVNERDVASCLLFDCGV
jgi:hypothetical protein